MASRRYLSRRKKTAWLVAGTVVVGGAALVLLWPRIQKLFTTGTIQVGAPTVSPTLTGYNFTG